MWFKLHQMSIMTAKIIFNDAGMSWSKEVYQGRVVPCKQGWKPIFSNLKYPQNYDDEHSFTICTIPFQNTKIMFYPLTFGNTSRTKPAPHHGLWFSCSLQPTC